ncbi:DUF4013 domain-containing protein [Halocatena halophila]|uniref:DUF4013 domain-containing protein n=1 Tax=Halocatena halophila TaxID=2814576 RepID=UPI002ED514CD
MLGDALVVPVAGDGSKRRLVAGSILLFVLQREAIAIGRFVSGEFTVGFNRATYLLAFGGLLALVGAIVIAGYHVRVLEHAIAASETLPALRPVRPLFRAGVVCFVYVLAAVVVTMGVNLLVFVWLTGASLGLAALSQATALPSSPSLIGLLGLFASALASGLVWYLLTVTLARYAATGTLKRSLAPQPVVRVGIHSGFFVGYVLAVSVLATIGFIGALLSLAIVGLPVLWYGMVAGLYAVGRGYRQAIGSEVSMRESFENR